MKKAGDDKHVYPDQKEGRAKGNEKGKRKKRQREGTSHPINASEKERKDRDETCSDDECESGKAIRRPSKELRHRWETRERVANHI